MTDKEKFFAIIGENLDTYPKCYKVLVIDASVNPTEIELYLPEGSKLNYVVHRSTWDNETWCVSCIRNHKLPEPLRGIDGGKEYDEDSHKQVWVNRGIKKSYTTFAEFKDKENARGFAESCTCYDDDEEYTEDK